MSARRGEIPGLAGLLGIAFAVFLVSYIGWGTWPEDGGVRFLVVALLLVLMGIGLGIWLGTQDKFWT